MRMFALLCVSLALAGCGKDSAAGPAAAGPANEFKVEAIFPNTIPVGKTFYLQPDGRSAIAVTCSGGPVSGGKIVFAGTELQSVWGQPCVFTATVPPELLAKPGTYQVWVRHNGTDSNKKDFVVTP